MELLEPDWNQDKPDWREAQDMCSRIHLEPVLAGTEPITRVLERLRATHSFGGAFLGGFRIEQNLVFDWFASRNRLLENDILQSLLKRNEVGRALPELQIPTSTEVSQSEEASCTLTSVGGFKFDNSFFFDGQLASQLFSGGAYGAEVKLTPREAKEMALQFCDAIFEMRYNEVTFFTSYEAWTPWFCGIAWDYTAVLFDRRSRILWLFVVTDSD